MNPEEYIVTARKWRPLIFRDVVGQEHITKTLKNAIKSNRIHHAFLFSGPRGVGKTTTARILARALNCENPNDTEPCNVCSSCISVLEGKSLDIIEIDGASNNSVDDVRRLRENTKYAPSTGFYKMYIIDEVHMLSTAAFNALLKTLEEPPPKLIFVFATTEPHKVPSTILSRCQRFEFHRIEIETIVKQIKFIAENENIFIDEESLYAIAKKADGSMRDAQSIFDRVVAFCGTNILYSDLSNALHLIDEEFYFRISSAIHDNNIDEMFKIAKDVTHSGYDLIECLSGLLEHFRNLLSVNIIGNSSFIVSSAFFLKKYEQQARLFTKAEIIRILNIISNTEQNIRFASQPKIKFELTLIQLASLDSVIEINELLNEIKQLHNVTSNSHTLSSKDSSPTQSNQKSSDFIKSVEINNISSPDTTLSPSYDEWNRFLYKYKEIDSDLQILHRVKTIKPLFFNNEILLQFPDKFLYEKIKKDVQIIEKYLFEFFKRKIRLSMTLMDPKESSSNQPSIDISPTSLNSITSLSSNTPDIIDSNNEIDFHSSNKAIQNDTYNKVTSIESIIIKNFGAEKIP